MGEQIWCLWQFTGKEWEKVNPCLRKVKDVHCYDGTRDIVGVRWCVRK